MSEVFKKANEIKDFMTQARQNFHQHPELAHKEFETTKYIKARLNEMGVELLDVDFNTGCIGIIKGEKAGANVVTGLRADIDALPIIEQTGVPYTSQNEGVMHACGHDGHTANLLGVAKVLNSMRDQFSGTVMLIFQPAEEGGRGANTMLAKGAFEKYKPDEVVALHAYPYVPTGQIGIMPGKAMAGADSFIARVIGKGGHGARPNESINPISAVASIISSISNIVSNQISTFDSVVISICTVHAGVAANVIPEEATFSGTVRCLENENRKIVRELIERKIAGISQSFGCDYELNYKEGVSALTNSKAVIDQIIKAGADSIGEENIIILDNPSMGSEDFSDFIMATDGNGAMFRLGCGKEDNSSAALHNHMFNFDDEALPYGCAVLSQYILNKHQ